MYNKSSIGWITPPDIDEVLVEYLDQVFPNKLPEDINITDRELGAKVGTRQVVDHLHALLQQQKETALEDVYAQETNNSKG